MIFVSREALGKLCHWAGVLFAEATSAMVHWRKALHLQCSQRCWEASDTSGSSVGPNALLAKVPSSNGEL